MGNVQGACGNAVIAKIRKWAKMIYKYAEERIFCDRDFISLILEAFQDLIAKKKSKIWKRSNQTKFQLQQ